MTILTPTRNLDEITVKKIVFIIGVLGAGKTTFLIELLKYLASYHPDKIPKIIVNDRGSIANLDYHRVTSATGMEATDIHGLCIGCEGKEDFIKIIQNTQSQVILVEPTGMFALSELEEISEEVNALGSSRFEFSAVHLLPVTQIESAVSITNHLSHPFVEVIGFTHFQGFRLDDIQSKLLLVQGFTDKPVELVDTEPSDELLERWIQLLLKKSSTTTKQEVEVAAPFKILSGPSMSTTHKFSPLTAKVHVCNHSGCSHPHHIHHGTEHHHEGQPYTKTIETDNLSLENLLAFLLSVGDNLVRFKGVVSSDDGGRILVQYAHGNWTQEVISSDTALPLKADIFTKTPIPEGVDLFQKLTDKAIDQLSLGIPPVFIQNPTQDFNILDPVGNSAWTLLYEQGQKASPETRYKAGQKLVSRCLESADYLLGDYQVLNLNPNLIDFYRMQAVMLYVWMIHEFQLTEDVAQTSKMQQVLEQISPENIDLDRLEGWQWEGGPDFSSALQNIWPEDSQKVLHLFQK